MDNVKKEYLGMYIGSTWQDYFNKNISSVVKLSNGYYYPFLKPQIKTTFCFGYGLYGVTNEEEEKEAADLVLKAKKDEDYFIQANLKELIDLETLISKREQTVYVHNTNKEHPIAGLSQHHYVNGYEPIEPLREEDALLLLNAIKEEKEKFLKRLRTYLKRYGLCKINAWSYLVD